MLPAHDSRPRSVWLYEGNTIDGAASSPLPSSVATIGIASTFLCAGYGSPAGGPSHSHWVPGKNTPGTGARLHAGSPSPPGRRPTAGTLPRWRHSTDRRRSRGSARTPPAATRRPRTGTRCRRSTPGCTENRRRSWGSRRRHSRPRATRRPPPSPPPQPRSHRLASARWYPRTGAGGTPAWRGDRRHAHTGPRPKTSTTRSQNCRRQVDRIADTRRAGSGSSRFVPPPTVC